MDGEIKESKGIDGGMGLDLEGAGLKITCRFDRIWQSLEKKNSGVNLILTHAVVKEGIREKKVKVEDVFDDDDFE